MKRISIIKRLFVIVLIFLLSINTFAVAVSDNDGASFISKAEFDELKSNFQSQIDTYNQSIDSKIDDAIATYLSDIRTTPIKNLDNRLEKLNAEYNVYWDNSTNGYQTTKPGYSFKLYVNQFFEEYSTSNRKNIKKYAAANTVTKTIVAAKSLPICNKDSSGKITINYYETRQTDWVVYGTWDMPYNDVINTTAAFQFGTSGHYQVLRDTNPCQNINVVNPPQVWCGVDNSTSQPVRTGDGYSSMVVTGSCSISTSSKDEKYILMNTNSLATTYYFNLDNTTKCTNTGSKTSGPFSMDNANWSAPTGSKSGTVNAITGAASIKYMPNEDTVDCPWSQGSTTSYDMYDARVNIITGKNKPIKDGIFMFEVSEKGTLKFEVTTNAAGSVRIYAFKNSAPSTYLVNDTISFSSATRRIYTYDINDTFAPTSKDKVEFWIIYKPNSGRNKIKVEGATLTVAT